VFGTKNSEKYSMNSETKKVSLVFATNNMHKLKEAKQILPPAYEILSLKDIGCDDDLPETGPTLEANAHQKARYIFDKFGMDCFADDTGLEVKALGGRPGVFSARFAGPGARSENNIEKLLTEMKGVDNRHAAFRTIIVLYFNNEEFLFEGKIQGTITEQVSGNSGFGYDPVFIPEGHSRTFSEMETHEKNKISHRAIALKGLNELLMQIRV
jgi:XTP/dITP diphosphohydrolase